MDADELRKLALAATEDANVLNSMTEEELAKVRRAINPAGGIVHNTGAFANLSIINYSEEARRKFIMLAMISYLHRMAMEWEPDTAEIMAKWRPHVETARGEARKEVIAKRDAEIAEHHKHHRAIVDKFLARNFEFNPDLHVRKSKTSGFSDPERVAVQQRIREDMEAKRVEEAKAALSKPGSFDRMKEITLFAYNEVLEAGKAVNGCIRALNNPENDAADKIAILIKRGKNLAVLQEKFGQVAKPLALADAEAAVRIELPAEVFHNFDRYITSHHSALTDVQMACYNEKPDLEYMAILYSVHRDEKEAKEFCKQHYRDFRTQVVTLSAGGATLLGSFKENLERVEYYDQNTEVLRELTKQNEADAKMGKDMLDKSIQRKKMENIREDGPDRDGLTQYRTSSIMGVATPSGIAGEHVGELGAKKIIDKDKMREIEAKVKDEQPAAATPGLSAASALPATASAATGVSSAASAPPMSKAEAKAAADAASAATPLEQRPQMTELARKTNIFNVESAFYERPPTDEFDAQRMSGNYTVNSTDPLGLPDDAIHMKMYVPVTDDNGRTSLVARDIFTAAEPPLHLESMSPYQNAYQPKRPAGTLLTEQTVTDSQGRQAVVHVVKTDP